MTTRMYSAHRRSVVRPIALLLAVAGAGYVAGAFFHGTAPLRGGSAALVQLAQASEPRDPLSANGTVAPTDAIDWVQSDRERILQPCECDVAKGISTACVFMD
jgi:hypothetical protein